MSEGILRKDEDGVIRSIVREDKTIIPLKINEEEKQIIKDAKRILEQAKDSTIIKQLMLLGYKSIKSPENQEIFKIFQGKVIFLTN